MEPKYDPQVTRAVEFIIKRMNWRRPDKEEVLRIYVQELQRQKEMVAIEEKVASNAVKELRKNKVEQGSLF